jgi:prepilin-type N-terminal cleavage/methylation domain-containing protein
LRRLWKVEVMSKDRLMRIAVFLCAAFSVSRGWPCDDTVRGKAFEESRNVHRLCLIADGADSASQALFSRLETWRAQAGAATNVELVRLDTRDDKVNWEDYGIPSAPPTLPVAVLAGFDNAGRRSFVIDHWEPGPTDSDLDALIGSPVREAIRREVGKRWAVLLYAPGSGSGARSIEAVIEAVSKRWSQEHAPGIAVVRLDRSDPRERLLCSFAGLAQRDKDAPAGAPDWVGVVFGRGKLMAPPLEGAEITEAALDALLSQLIEICSCLRPPSMMGVDIPMSWGPEDEKSVASLLSPEAQKALEAALASDKPAAAPSSHAMLKATLSAIGFLTIVVFGGTIAMLRRDKRRPAAFTLIELLIVVAIIAILAAIAVPNFLEAQTRAKISRVRSDMRTLSTALEAYFVDWNHYPYFDRYNLPPRYNEIIYHLIPLTTPVAYLTTVNFRDPFLSGDCRGYNDGIPRYYYNYRNHEFWQSTSAPGFVVPVWVLNGLGPDGAPNQGLNAELWARGYVAANSVTIYDPTNGTVSDGDMPRTGGETRFYGYPK